LKRALQKLVIDPLATRLLTGDFQPGDHIEADAEGDAIVFRKAVRKVGEEGVAA
jgi:ATP-dependent Clp protease ATP-binding subunit ClpB